MNKNKFITKLFAVSYIISLCVYATMILGSVTHELVHKHYAVKPIAMTVNWDCSGNMTAGAFYRHSHEWVYLQGFIVIVFLMMLTMISLLIILL